MLESKGAAHSLQGTEPQQAAVPPGQEMEWGQKKGEWQLHGWHHGEEGQLQELREQHFGRK